MTGLRFDEIGYWSEIKLDIVRKYAQAYSTVLAKEPRIRNLPILRVPQQDWCEDCFGHLQHIP